MPKVKPERFTTKQIAKNIIRAVRCHNTSISDILALEHVCHDVIIMMRLGFNENANDIYPRYFAE